MHYPNDWACADFDLIEFLGVDDQPYNSSNYTPIGNQQPEYSGKEEKEDYMYGIMQYNDVAYDNQHQQSMYGHHDMNGSFLQDDRYQQNTSAASGPLNNAINKLHQQQSQQPSTSRLSSVSNNQAQSSYPSRMRPQLANALGLPTQLNGDLTAESVLLPTSSTSPQNALYMQTLVKQEPVYNNEDYFDSTSDNDSHYSGNRLIHPSAKPRKYRVKPDCEKANPQYKMKRCKNNEAVRRSREKAKHAQVEKEKRLGFLESEHNDHYKQTQALKRRIQELENENAIMRKNCNCGNTPQQMFRR